MTEKQRALLSKYLTEDRVEKLSRKQFNTVSNFIGMILHYRWFHPVVGEMCNVPYLTREPTKEERHDITKIITENRDSLDLLTDEGVWVEEVRFFPNSRNWFTVKQSWFKGMSNSPSSIFRWVSESGDRKFEGIYNVLFDLGVYSIGSLQQMYVDALQQRIDEEFNTDD